MKKFAILAKFLVVFVAIVIILGCSIYKFGIGPVSNSEEVVNVTISKGDTWYSISSTLKDDGLIRSEAYYKFYIKLIRPGELQTGKYSLSPNMGIEKIVDKILEGSTFNEDDVSITFPEGKNMRYIAKQISINTKNSYDSVFELLSDNSYLDELINSYWFLTDDIKNNNIYYSLEGYLFPNTYSFNKNSSVRDILKVMLEETNNKLNPYKSEFQSSKYSIHKLMTLASIVELEAGNSNERQSVAGVFYNRIENNWTLGSDVTAYYAYKMDDWSNGLTSKQINECNAYNTRGTCFIGLPVGPICNPSMESIKAVLEPTSTEMFYFVADCDGKTYLTKTQTEHDKKIDELKKNGNWCDQ